MTPTPPLEITWTPGRHKAPGHYWFTYKDGSVTNDRSSDPSDYIWGNVIAHALYEVPEPYVPEDPKALEIAEIEEALPTCDEYYAPCTHAGRMEQLLRKRLKTLKAEESL